jgi:hypothetical protein
VVGESGRASHNHLLSIKEATLISISELSLSNDLVKPLVQIAKTEVCDRRKWTGSDMFVWKQFLDLMGKTDLDVLGSSRSVGLGHCYTVYRRI